MELLKAFQILKAELPNIELHYFGGGQGAPAASPGVTFHPAYEAEQLPEIMSSFSVGVIPSLFPETYSYVLSELWMAGKPVAASRIGSLAERIRDGENGKLFTPGNVPSMIETLRWYAQSDEWRSWNIERPRKMETMLDDYKKLYASIES
jgi:glycosyltransferase involved in cell wall biosynthesis